MYIFDSIALESDTSAPPTNIDIGKIDSVGGYWRFPNAKTLATLTKGLFTDTKVVPVAVSVFGDIMFYDGKKYVKVLRCATGKTSIIVSGLKFFYDNMKDAWYQKEYFDIDMYQDAVKKLGKVSDSECYCCEPLPGMGGKFAVENMSKGKLREYIALCTSKCW